MEQRQDRKIQKKENKWHKRQRKDSLFIQLKYKKTHEKKIREIFKEVLPGKIPSLMKDLKSQN